MESINIHDSSLRELVENLDRCSYQEGKLFYNKEEHYELWATAMSLRMQVKEELLSRIYKLDENLSTLEKLLLNE